MSQSLLLSKSGGKKEEGNTLKWKVSVPEFDNSSLIKGYSKTLIGRCMNPLRQDMKALLFMLPRIWQLEERVVGDDLGLGRFQFDFDNEEDIEAVLKMEPFHFDYWMLVLVRWEPIVTMNYPSAIMFWVRVMGVPLHFWAQPTFKSIGDALGVFMEVDLNEGRIQVVMDAFKPLLFSTVVEFHSGEETMVSLRYEKLVGFCRICNSMCHDQARCPTKENILASGNNGLLDKSDKLGQGLHTESYKAVTSRSLEKSNEIGKDKIEEVYKGKEVAKDHHRHVKPANDYRSYKERRNWEDGEGTSRRFKSGYQPRDFQKRYAISTKGLNKLNEVKEGCHLSEHEAKMMEAFHSKSQVSESVAAVVVPKSVSKARKELRFDEGNMDLNKGKEISEEPVSTGNIEEEETRTATKEHQDVEMEEISARNLVEEIQVIQVTAVEDDHLEAGNTNFSVQMDGVVEDITEEDEQIDEDALTVVNTNQVEQNETTMGNQGRRRKLGRPGNVIIGGSTKKRLVQALISPRKRLIAKQGSKNGESTQAAEIKDTLQPKKVAKPKVLPE